MKIFCKEIITNNKEGKTVISVHQSLHSKNNHKHKFPVKQLYLQTYVKTIWYKHIHT